MVACPVFGRIAYVEDVDRARRVFPPSFDGGSIDARDAELARNLFRGVLGPGEARARHIRRAVGVSRRASEPGEVPAHGAVAQRDDLIRYTGINQRLGADDAAGTSGAV